MTNTEWFAYYDEHKLAFKWFILGYFQADVWLHLERDRIAEDKTKMLIAMNQIWFHLPDNRFNITRNPLGWSEFLSLVEE